MEIKLKEIKNEKDESMLSQIQLWFSHILWFKLYCHLFKIWLLKLATNLTNFSLLSKASSSCSFLFFFFVFFSFNNLSSLFSYPFLFTLIEHLKQVQESTVVLTWLSSQSARIIHLALVLIRIIEAQINRENDFSDHIISLSNSIELGKILFWWSFWAELSSYNCHLIQLVLALKCSNL